MKELLFFEWKKIFEKRLNVIAMVVGYLLILGVTVSYIMQEEIWDSKSGQYVSGVRAYEARREQNEGMTDYLTEDFLTDFTRQLQTQCEEKGGISLDSDEGYIEVVRPNGVELVYLLGDMYTEKGDLVELEKLNKISADEGIQFYERRMEKISNYLNLDFSYGNYSEQEKEFWLNMAEQVQTPFQWGDDAVMDLVRIIIGIAFYLLFVIVICVAPVFASEYESGAVALLLTTKRGKTTLITAKILTAVVFAITYLSIGIGSALLILGMVVGFWGSELPVQLWSVSNPYNWNLGEACGISVLIMLLIALTITLLTLAWSSRSKSGFSVLVLDFLLLVAPVFLPMSKNSGLWNHIRALFPAYTMNIREVMETFVSYQFGDVVLSYMSMTVLVYLVVSVISLFSIRGGFAKHQVK